MAKYFLSSLGIISSLGSSKDETLNNLISGKSNSVEKRDDFIANKSVTLACVNDDLPEIPKHLNSYDIRCNQLLLAAYLQIKDDVQNIIKKYGKDRIAVVIGSGTSGINEGQKGVEHYLKKGFYPENFNYNFFEMGTPAKFLAKYLELENIFYTVSTACSSGAKALLSAKNLLDLGVCDAVLVGGSDDLCKLTVNGFNALEAVSDKICNPFSKNRTGITLGEGATLMIMSKEKGDIALLSVGESSDAYHTTAPDPSGKGAKQAMKAALEKAGLEPKDIDYINLHGTGTIANDQMEGIAVNEIFGEKTLCSSTKSLTGHTLGCAGIIEIALCWLLLSSLNQEQNLPPHLWDQEQDENIPKLNLTKSGCKTKILTCLSNSFAFGGSNVSVIIGKI